LSVALHRFLAVPRVTAAHDFPLHNRVRFVWLDDEKIDRLSFKKREQQFLRNRIVPIILFEDLQVRFAGRIAQNHRIGLKVGGCFGKAHIVYALLQVERNDVTHHREILIVNRESRLAGEKQRRERDADQHCSRGPWPLNECSSSFHVAELNTRRAKNRR